MRNISVIDIAVDRYVLKGKCDFCIEKLCINHESHNMLRTGVYAYGHV